MKDEYIMELHIGHDRSVAIIKNGVLVYALPQERVYNTKLSLNGRFE